ncbi:hypothetical protein ACGFXB_07355 [Streptomyces canus]
MSDGRLSELLWGWSPPATINAQICTYEMAGSDAEGRAAASTNRSACRR